MDYLYDKNMYVASAAPIIVNHHNGYYTASDDKEYFLVNRVYTYNFFGRKKLVGFAEAISKEMLFTGYYLRNDFDPDGWVFNDYITRDKDIGVVSWDCNLEHTANELLNSQIIDDYMKQTPEEMINKIEEVRRKSKEVLKTDSFKLAMNKR